MNLVKMLVVGLIIALQPLFMYGQVVIGHAPPDGSAALDIQGTTMGVLLPRLTTAERNAITAPATGLMIFNTTTFCLEVNNGTGSSPEWSAFRCRRGAVTSLDCAGVTVTGTLTAGQAASGVSASVPYMGGNIGVYSDQEVSSTGVTGLTATLSAGTLADGSGSISFDITGTPSGGGVASFALNFGGQSCTVAVNVAYVCKAKTDATTFSNFLCYNLGAANTSADPFTPSWEINGGYWQWGSKAQAAPGPTGPSAAEANDGAVSGWNATVAPIGSWSDASKTANDPCPAGYRVPTEAQWLGVIANNTKTSVGTWTNSPTNYSSGKMFGNDLFLPAAGSRLNSSGGALSNRGLFGECWSSSDDGTGPIYIEFRSSSNYTDYDYNPTAYSVRCIEYQSAIFTLDCGGSTVTGALIPGQVASGVSVSVPYTGGDGSAHSGQTVSSTGITGLTATLSAGNFASGSGSLSYDITGTPSAVGTASFALNIGGHSCTVDVNVAYVCKAKTDATTFSKFLCYNLGAANTSANPFTPSWEINGGYWQWGRKAQAAAGPTGPNAGDANDGAVSGWNTTAAPNGSWSDVSRTSNDPCPAGYRVPTSAQWSGVIANNTKINVGAWTNSPTNYSSGKMFGNDLLLPATGSRNRNDGGLLNRGEYGNYWSSSAAGSILAFYMSFYDGAVNTYGIQRWDGLSVRCIEYPSAISSLDCGGSNATGTLSPGQAASGVSVSVPYTGGDGSAHSGQTVSSTGVTGLTATLSAGSFANGSGSLSYVITGTPSAVGTASFALNIGGQSCTLDLEVACRAKTDATTFSKFLCYNLGAANTSANPFTPSWEINGGYWQWGRKAQAAAGPTGPGAAEANSGPISGWDDSEAPDGSWVDGSKSSNDPCPSGYRVPTKAQWQGVVANNTSISIGTWTASPTNYSSGRMFGNDLFLPANGYINGGESDGHGSFAYYWSSNEDTYGNAWYLYFDNGSRSVGSDGRYYGVPVRCIEYTSAISSLDCGGSTVTGTLITGQAASGVSVSVPYTGGDGSAHSGQTVSSTGITGLTATLSAGSFANGSGTFSYVITGTPSRGGVASFALEIGGQSCKLDLNVLCRAKTDATTFSNFLCYNLGAANTSADPFTPSWEINGGYWQWGRLAQAAPGPTGPSAAEANDGAVSGWNATVAPIGSWSDASKTANDPCPAGFRVPTKAQWLGVIANNTKTSIGTWTNSPTNYSSGKMFGNDLFLPATGIRLYTNGALNNRGLYGECWSSSDNGGTGRIYIEFSSSSNYTDYDYNPIALPVRCIAE